MQVRLGPDGVECSGRDVPFRVWSPGPTNLLPIWLGYDFLVSASQGHKSCPSGGPPDTDHCFSVFILGPPISGSYQLDVPFGHNSHSDSLQVASRLSREFIKSACW